MVQNFVLPLLELHEIPASPHLQPVEDLLNVNPPVIPPPSFGSPANLLETKPCTIIQLINKDCEQDWTQYWSLGYTANYWPSLVFTNHHPGRPRLSSSFQSILQSTHPAHTSVVVFNQSPGLMILEIFSNLNESMPLWRQKPAFLILEFRTIRILQK